MTSGGRPEERARARARMLLMIRERLEAADHLTGAMGLGLSRADADSVEAAHARLQTLVLEFKLLAEEYRRLGPADDEESREPSLAEAGRALTASATRLARTAAVSGGLLERLLGITHRLLSLLGDSRGGTYLPTGRSPEPAAAGVLLREQA